MINSFESIIWNRIKNDNARVLLLTVSAHYDLFKSQPFYSAMYGSLVKIRSKNWLNTCAWTTSAALLIVRAISIGRTASDADSCHAWWWRAWAWFCNRFGDCFPLCESRLRATHSIGIICSNFAIMGGWAISTIRTSATEIIAKWWSLIFTGASLTPTCGTSLGI